MIAITFVEESLVECLIVALLDGQLLEDIQFLISGVPGQQYLI
jgi:hypothetical protein